jgi:hypothetical protein
MSGRKPNSKGESDNGDSGKSVSGPARAVHARLWRGWRRFCPFLNIHTSLYLDNPPTELAFCLALFLGSPLSEHGISAECLYE